MKNIIILAFTLMAGSAFAKDPTYAGGGHYTCDRGCSEEIKRQVDIDNRRQDDRDQQRQQDKEDRDNRELNQRIRNIESDYR